jgi:hypothetical protein
MIIIQIQVSNQTEYRHPINQTEYHHQIKVSTITNLIIKIEFEQSDQTDKPDVLNVSNPLFIL